MSDTTRQRVQVDAPELGASVYLVEASISEFMPIWARAEDGEKMTDLFLAVLGASLEVDGVRVPESELRQYPASKIKSVLRLGTEAMRINGMVAAATEDSEKKARPKKSSE